MKKKRILIVGAGSRGNIYADCLAKHSDRVDVIAVAEPRGQWRENFAVKHNIPPENVFVDWSEPLNREKFADAVILATPDNLHTAPAIAYARKGYHILLEKPMAPTISQCVEIASAVKESGVMCAVCHVLRYAPYTRKLKEVLDSGIVGQPVSVQHLEPVGYWHQAHSFVRGNWRNERESSFMLLAKSCHDIDWLVYIMGQLPEKVSSFGRLSYFVPENAPEGSTERCLDCTVEKSCPYSAKKIYLGMLARGNRSWPLDVLTRDITEQGIIKALREGPYGRCVYSCDNDVVDHQVVSIEFAGGQTGVFTMTAFTRPDGHRYTRIFGTQGEIVCNCNTIEIYDFLTGTSTAIDINAGEEIVDHAGGDQSMIDCFVEALCENNPDKLLSGVEETLITHGAVFGAEQARREAKVVDLRLFGQEHGYQAMEKR